MAIDPISKKAGDSGFSGSLPLDNPAVADALRRGNVQETHKLLTDYGFIAPVEFEKFVAQSHSELTIKHIQPDLNYALPAYVGPPQMDQFPLHNNNAAFSADDIKLANDGLSKAMTVGKATSAAATTTSTSSTSTSTSAAATLSNSSLTSAVQDWNNFYDTIDNKMLMQNVVSQSEEQYSKVKQEFEKIAVLAKSANIDDSILIVAIAKYLMSKSGIEVAKQSVDVMVETKKQDKLVDTLKNSSQDLGQYYGAKQGLTDSSTTMQAAISNINQLANYMTGTMGFADSTLKLMNNAKAEIIKHMAGQ